MNAPDNGEERESTRRSSLSENSATDTEYLPYETRLTISKTTLQFLNKKYGGLLDRINDRRRRLKYDLDPHSQLYSIGGKVKRNRSDSDSDDESAPIVEKNPSMNFSRRILSHEDFKDPRRILSEQTIHNETEKESLSAHLLILSNDYLHRRVERLEKDPYTFHNPPYDFQYKDTMNIALYSLVSDYPYNVLSKIMLGHDGMTLFQDLYWYIIVLFYQDYDYENIIKQLDHSIAFLYVKMENCKIYRKEYFLKMLPFLYGYAILKTFYYMFPSSRYTMDRTFEIEVYTRLSQRLLGEELCPASIDLLSNQYFPDNNGIKKKDIFELTEDTTPDSLFQQKPKYMVNSVRDKTLPSIHIYDDTESLSKGKMRMRQLHGRFDLTTLNPLKKELYQPTGFKRDLFLGRVTPIPRCRYGGTNTFKPHDTKTMVEKDDVRKEYYKEKKTLTNKQLLPDEYIQTMNRNIKKCREVEERGSLAVGRMAIDLMHKRDQRRERELHTQKFAEMRMEHKLNELTRPFSSTI